MTPEHEAAYARHLEENPPRKQRKFKFEVKHVMDGWNGGRMPASGPRADHRDVRDA